MLKMDETLTRLAAEEQRRFDAGTLPRTRKERGHFGTAPVIADFMAGMFTEIPEGPRRILDPGAGVGTLSAAVCQRVLQQKNRRHLIFDLWENDPDLAPRLCATMEACKKSLKDAGHEMQFTILFGDFVLDHAQPSLFGEASGSQFDLVIMNPPYFKVRKESKYAQAMAHVVYGQPNIYAFFMAIAADLLRDGGEMVAITPRSYFNGPYFKRFRKWFFDRMTARQIHVFQLRTDAFREDEVLQENVILMAKKGAKAKDVLLTSSIGRDLHRVERHVLIYYRVIEDSSGDHLVRLATSELEQRIIEAVDRLPHRFRELPFKISTGPVVSFRSRAFLRRDRSEKTAPLLWLHNVRPFVTRFPPKNGKPMHIIVSNESKRLLLPAKRYVLLKRFTAKEERRRLVAGIVESKDSYSPFLGLENHLNYVYRPTGELSTHEALGLATFFNSALVDRYFRAISGNTQVNAAEIRAMPFPSLDTIREIGQAVEKVGDRSPPNIEKAVGEVLGLPKTMIKELCEIAK
jgi:adenine-specific DNA-methyltransferase